MHLISKLLCSPWFWSDAILACIGGVIVYWGLSVERNAGKHIPPTDFRPDLFEDILKSQKAELERGWNILMVGIIVEVVAAFVISVISGLEIADLSEKSAASNLEAKQAGEDAADAKLLAASTESNNLVLKSNLVALEYRLQTRRITKEQKEAFIKSLNTYPKGSVKVIVGGLADTETENYANQFREMLDGAGYGEENSGKVIHLGTALRISGGGIGDRSDEASSGVYFVWFGDSKTNLNAKYFSLIRTNGVVYISYDKSITNNFRAAPLYISQSLQSIGIIPAIQVTKAIPDISKDGDWCIFINQKY